METAARAFVLVIFGTGFQTCTHCDSITKYFQVFCYCDGTTLLCHFSPLFIPTTALPLSMGIFAGVQACGTAGGTVTLFNRCFLAAAALRIDLPVPVHTLHMGADQVICREPCVVAHSSSLPFDVAVGADLWDQCAGYYCRWCIGHTHKVVIQGTTNITTRDKMFVGFLHPEERDWAGKAG